MGFTSIGFALTTEAAYTFAKSRADALILNVGLTFEIEDTIEKKNQLQLSITRARELLAAVHHSGRKPVCVLSGGSVTKPEDFDEFIRQVQIHGHAGGSVFDRFTVLTTINFTVRKIGRASVREEV